jgi:hypothetical protein
MEVTVRHLKTLAACLIVFFVAGTAAADLKVVKKVHRDAYTIMGQSQPAEDSEQVTWIGDERMHMDMGDSATIVRLDSMKLYSIDHTAQTYNVLDLPVDLEALLPPEMQPMIQMMNFEVTVTPTDEHKQVGEWKARRYDVEMATAMMTIKMVQWAAEVDGYDPSTFNDMYVHLNSLQPGMASAVEELAKIDGFVVAQESVITMMGNDIKSSEQALSIEKATAPAGTYDPPEGYTEKPFDFMASMQ